jgi:hypothetical protein
MNWQMILKKNEDQEKDGEMVPDLAIVEESKAVKESRRALPSQHWLSEKVVLYHPLPNDTYEL